MKCWSLFILTCLLSQYADSCSTPLGVQRQCIYINDCPSFISAFRTENLTLYYDFILKSHCGYKDNIPLVCCGPLPIFDPVSSTDSFPAPPGTCGVNGITDKIMNGHDTNMGEFPWMTLLGHLDKTLRLTFLCGGALINQRYVLTAAHCVTGTTKMLYGNPTLARLGEYDLTKEIDCQGEICANPVQDIFITSIHSHNDYSYDAAYYNDIALLRLAKRAELNDYVKPICLIGKDMQLTVGTNAMVAGWGRTLSVSESNVKQKLHLTINDKALCVTLLLSDSRICVGGKFRMNDCHGDSGGPLMIQNSRGHWEVAGIGHTGYGCLLVSSAYTPVSSYIDWILATLESSNV